MSTTEYTINVDTYTSTVNAHTYNTHVIIFIEILMNDMFLILTYSIYVEVYYFL